ncbi:MAG: 5-deoxy-glucuronate isomerase [Christensenellaceae bacterium]
MALLKAKRFNNGINVVCDERKNPEAQMGFSVVKLDDGGKFNLLYPEKECAVLLMFGKATFKWEGQEKTIERKSCFHDAPYCLCTPAGVKVELEAHADNTQFAVMTTNNEKKFASRFYTPEDAPNENRGAGTLNECSTRIVRSIRGRGNCPETNFVMGEVVNSPGKWSSFPPHSHPHPEIYYFKFLPSDKNGFGFSQDGFDIAYQVKENDAILAVDGDIHAQVAAPGYAMYYVWVIVDSDLNPYSLPPSVEEFGWTVEEGAKFFPDI